MLPTADCLTLILYIQKQLKTESVGCIHNSVYAYIFMHMCACVYINDNNQRQKRLSIGE